MKIYTRHGDDGTTGLFGTSTRLVKSDLVFELIGTVDELNALLGEAECLSRSLEESDKQFVITTATILDLQEVLFTLGADIATPQLKAESVRLEFENIFWLEQSIDAMTAELKPLTRFVLPGGHPLAAKLHTARTVCRRAERLAVGLTRQFNLTDRCWVAYLNRLSDHLFTFARYVNRVTNTEENVWENNNL